MASATTNHQSPVATTYARALLELASEQRQAEVLARELNDLQQILRQEPSFRAFLSDPAVAESEREQVLKRAFEGRISPLLYNFLGVLNAKGRLRLLDEIADAYETQLWEQMGKVEVNVTVAERLDPAQLEQVRRSVGAALGKDAVVHQFVDPSIIGGLVLRVQDQLIDASVRTQLQLMKQRILTGRPKA